MAINFKPVGEPGQADLHVTDWQGEARPLELSLRSNASQNNHLDSSTRTWVGAPCWILLAGGRVQNGELVIRVQADLVDPLLTASARHSFQGYVRVAGQEEQRHRVRVEPGIKLSAAMGDAPVSAPPIAALPPTPPVLPDPPPGPQTPVESGPLIGEQEPSAAEQTKKGRSVWPIASAAAAALLLAAGAAGYFLLSGDKAENPSPVAETAVPTPQGGCNKDQLASAPALTFVQDCVRDVRDSAALLSIIQAARDTGKCEIAQRLYANRANAGDAMVAMAYAQEYDPASYRENTCFKPEAATAKYWYESVLEKNPQHAEASARLQALPQ